jgi:hypothetical protein
MDTFKRIEVLSKKTLEKVRVEISLILTEEVEMASCCYHFLSGWVVRVNPRAILQGSLIRNVFWQDYLNAVLSHELGHIIDPEYEDLVFELQYDEPSEQRSKEIYYRLEYRAWKNGERFVEGHNLDLYNLINEKYVNKFAIAS